MTPLQIIAIIAIGIVVELYIFFAAVLFSEPDNGDQIKIGVVVLNTLVIIGVLLAWANGMKFPLK